MVSSKLLFLFRVLPFLGILCSILISSIPGSSISALEIQHLDKVAHFFVFSVLCTLFCLRHHFVKKHTLKITMLKSGIYSFAYGIFEEAYQHFVPGRSSDLYDLAANVLGIAFSLFVFYAICRHKTKQKTAVG